MNIKIGEKLRSLRKKHDITQDKFAEYLGVTAQAVSRWENAICYPDVDFFPAIANFFGITIDELFESDRSMERLKQLTETIYRKGADGYADEAIQIARQALSEFPNNCEIMYELKNQLFYKDPIGNKDEIFSLSNRILDDCTDDTIRHGTIQTMAVTYFKSGDEASAKKMVSKLSSMWCSEEAMMPIVTSGEDKMFHQMRKIYYSCDILSNAISGFAQRSDVNNVDKITLFEKSIQVLSIVFDDGNYGFYNHTIAYTYVYMAQCYLALNDYSNALDCIEKAADHTIAFENCIGDETEFTAVLVSKIPNPPNYHHDKPTSMSYDLINDYFMAKEIYVPIRDNERFKFVIIRLANQSSNAE